MAAANLSERIGAREISRPRPFGNSLLARVNQVGVNLLFFRKRANAEQSVLGLERDVHSFRNVVRDERRNADAEIHIIAIAQFLGGASRHKLAHRVFFL